MKSHSVCLFLLLYKADWHVLKHHLLDKTINRITWTSVYALVTSYVLPLFGLRQDYGIFLLGGLVASIGLLETYSCAAGIIADLAGERRISYYLTLPISSTVVFVEMIFFYATELGLLGVFMLPIGNLFLRQKLAWSSVSWGKFGIIFMLVSLFHGALTVWAASVTPSLAHLGNVWSRILHPMWFLGGFQYSWQSLHHVLPTLGWCTLGNPVTYTMDGVRAALLGQEGFINIWICAGMLVVFTILLSCDAIRRLNKRLDCV